ncbi:MAG TPA: hypothetical protein VIM06_10980 [Rhodanobacter sp.]
MSIFERVAKVRVAQARMAVARDALSTPAASLLVRSREHPLTTVGTAAGAGFVLGSFNVHPLHVPGLGPLLSGGLAEAVAFGTRLITELGTAGLAGADRHAGERSPDERNFDASDTSGGAP